MSKIKVGFSRTPITPMMGIGLAGYFKTRLCDGVLDDIEANVLAVEKEGKVVLLISLDILDIPIEYEDKIRNEIASKVGVDKEAVFMSATHSHTAPYVGVALEGAPQDLTDRYTAEMSEKIIAASKEAVKDLKEARVGYAIGNVPGISFVRRFLMKDGSVGTNPGINNPNVVKPLGEIDTAINVIRFDREGADTVVLTNYGCHPDTIGGNKISTDWPGFFRRTFEKAIDGTKCIFFNGAEGEINHIKVFPTGGDMNDMTIDFDDVPRGYGHAIYMGRVVAGAVMQVYDKVEYVPDGDINYAIRKIGIPTNKANKEELERAHKLLELHVAGRDDEIPEKGMMLTTVVAEAERMCNLEFGPDTIEMNLSAVRLGDFVLVGVSGEPFNDIGMSLKKAEGYRCVMPVCLTNGSIGYFAMNDSYKEGGYEARTSPFKAGVGELIIEEGLKLLKEIK